MEHTKGEWAWQKFGEKYLLTAQHGTREIIIASNKVSENTIDSRTEVVMNKDGVLKSIDPNHPNAKLIAAAPELLEALIDIKDRLNAGLNDDDIRTIINQAIKKATT